MLSAIVLSSSACIFVMLLQISAIFQSHTVPSFAAVAIKESSGENSSAVIVSP
jgi:hypothetical protein